jgi:hypothetical protein
VGLPTPSVQGFHNYSVFFSALLYSSLSDPATMEDKKVVLDSGSSEELDQGFNSNDNGYDTVATKKLIRKIDFVLIPWLALLYLYSSLSPRTSCSS